MSEHVNLPTKFNLFYEMNLLQDLNASKSTTLVSLSLPTAKEFY